MSETTPSQTKPEKFDVEAFLRNLDLLDKSKTPHSVLFFFRHERWIKLLNVSCAAVVGASAGFGNFLSATLFLAFLAVSLGLASFSYGYAIGRCD